MQLRLASPPRVDSPLARLDPRWRLAGLVVCLVALAAVRSLPAALAGLALALALAASARPPLPWLRPRLLFVAAVVAAFALPLPLLGAGWAEAATLAARAIGVFLVASALLVSASLESTLAASSSLGVPRLFARLAQMSLRYLMLLGEELARLRVALRVRGFRNRANAHSYRTVAAASGMLLVRGGARADRVAHAMRCRGFDGTFRTLERGTTAARDVLFLLAMIALAVSLVCLDRAVLGGVAMTAALEVAGLCFAYPGGRLALDDVSCTLGAGESVGLVGPNGAGKTSLFLCLAGVLPPRAGRVVVAGLDVRDPAQRRRLPGVVGIVFQDSDDQLFESAVAADVAFGPLNLGLPADEVRLRVAEALAQVGMAGHEGRVPFHLSGGEKRRVALAGVLAMRPALLLLDEPTMFLDPRGTRELAALLPTLPGAKLIATHDLEFVVATCSRVLVLDAGRLVAGGPTREILADAALMQRHGLEVPWSLR